MKIYRRLRIIEYIGSEEFISRQIEQAALKGTKTLVNGSMRSAWLGETNELLLDSEVRDVEAERKKSEL